MTDIEKLRDDVIKAARAADRDGVWPPLEVDWEALREKLDALDAAMRPNAWKLLAGTIPHLQRLEGTGPLLREITTALRWRQENPDA